MQTQIWEHIIIRIVILNQTVLNALAHPLKHLLSSDGEMKPRVALKLSIQWVESMLCKASFALLRHQVYDTDTVVIMMWCMDL